MKLAVIAGSALRESGFARDGARVEHAGVSLLDVDGTVVLQRHGLDAWNPPHRIDHRAHFAALLDAGVTHVLALSSVGSLRLDWPVGTVVLADDCYAPAVTLPFWDDERSHQIPRFDAEWRATVLATWRAGTGTPIVDGGVYAQTSGPRFETRAEVRALTAVADLVGMTVASECVLASEIGLPYAAVCVVDNLANGLDAHPLTMAEFHAGVVRNRDRLIADLDAVVPTLVRHPA